MNVLILLTDQQQRGSLGAYGNPHVLTPNLDRFAQEGTVFEHAICTQPVCVPSRCSLFSGVYPHTHGVFDNYHPLPRQFQTLGDMVIDEGVRTGYLGKWHLGREVLPQRGFEEFFHAVDDNYTSDADFPLYGLSGYGQWLVDKGYVPDGGTGAGRFSREHVARLPAKHSKPAFIAEQGCRFLDARQDEPFLLVCSFLEPHNPYHSEFDDLHDREAIELPANFHMDPLADWPTRNERFQQWAREKPHGDESPQDTEEKWRDMVARYYGLCHLVDNYAQSILDKLSALGLDDNTLVIYTSDHGDMMASHGMYMKSMMYEESLGVPLMMRGPGITAGRRVTEPASLVDIAPTVLDFLGIDAPNHLQGRNLLPLLRGERPEDHDHAVVGEWNGVIQNMFKRHDMFADVQGQWIRTLRTKRWKLNVHVGDRSELYDLQNDPGEMRNLINDPSHRHTLDALFTRLQQWQQEHGDIVDLPHPLQRSRGNRRV